MTMKYSKKGLLISITLFLILPMFFSPTHAIEYEFSVEKDDVYIWTITECPKEYLTVDKGTKYRLKVDAIDNGTMDFIDGTILNMTFDEYNTFYTNPEWINGYTNETYMVYNESTWEISFEIDTSDIRLLGLLLIIPTPFNFTWIGNYLNDSFNFVDFRNTSHTLIMTNDYEVDFFYNFNENGILTEFNIGTQTAPPYQLKFGDIDVNDKDKDDEPDNGLEIPFGNYYLIISAFSIAILIIINKKKT